MQRLNNNCNNLNIKHSTDVARNVSKTIETTETTETIMNPITGRITRKFGKQKHPVTGQTSFHNGVDIACPAGTAILAPEDGIILELWEDQKGGMSLSMISYDGTRFGFAHLSKQLVTKGTDVKTGEPIALSGNSGMSTGPHLHLTVKKYGVFVDPLQYFDF